MRTLPFLALASIALAGAAAPLNPPRPPQQEKLLIAHRGASAYAPEHTRAAYELAIAQGADYVEQDLGVTKDGVLVCLHDDSLERTTNVREVFPDRFTFVGTARRWMLADFTLAEVKQLDAGSWFHRKFAGERVLTFDEAVEIVRGRAGLYPELKSPALYRERGIDMVALLAASLRRHGLDRPPNGRPPLIVQSFDAEALKQLAAELPDVPRVFLIDVRIAHLAGGRCAVEDPRVRRRDRAAQIDSPGRSRRRDPRARCAPDGHALHVPLQRHGEVSRCRRRDAVLPLRAERRRGVHG